MSVTSWLRNRKTRPIRRPAFRPRLQSLEDRCVPSFGWASATGASSAVATDSAGNAYVTGSTTAKYSRSGALIWTDNVVGTGIAVDATGTNVYVVGQSAGTSVVQLDGATGSVNWTQPLPGTTGDAVAVDGAGAAYTTSHAQSGARGSPGFSYVTKLDAGGTQQWQDTITTGHWIGVIAPTVSTSGDNVYVSATFAGNATFAIGSSSVTLTANKGSGGYVLKLTSGNTYVWSKAFQPVGGGGDVWSNHIAADSAGNVYAYGTFLGKVNFTGSTSPNGPGVLNSGNSAFSAFVTKLTLAGSVAWAKQFGAFADLSFDPDNAKSIAVDGSGAVYLTGYFYGTTSFNPAGGGSLASAGGTDIFVSKLNTNGVFQWAVRAGGTGNDSGNGIAVDSFGDIYVTGSIGAGTTDFDLTQSYFDNRDLLTGPGAILWQITQP